jgi:hypothetical protein
LTIAIELVVAKFIRQTGNTGSTVAVTKEGEKLRNDQIKLVLMMVIVKRYSLAVMNGIDVVIITSITASFPANIACYSCPPLLAGAIVVLNRRGLMNIECSTVG